MLLAANPRGLIVVRSELAGFLGQLEKHGSSDAERGFYNKSWDGGVYYVDRIKYEEGAKLIKYNSLAIVASVQPDKLQQVFSGPNDGLFTRFLYIFSEPVPPRPPKNQGNKERIACLRDAFDRLHSLAWSHDYEGREVPGLLDVENDGVQILQRVREEIYQVTKNTRGILATWRGKNPGTPYCTRCCTSTFMNAASAPSTATSRGGERLCASRGLSPAMRFGPDRQACGASTGSRLGTKSRIQRPALCR